MGGPLWSEPIHDAAFVAGLRDAVVTDAAKYGTATRMQGRGRFPFQPAGIFFVHHSRVCIMGMAGLVTLIAEELLDCPLYYTLPGLSGTVHSQSPPQLAFRSALVRLGHRVSLSHAHPNAIKTDAPPRVVWDIMREWVRLNPVAAVNPLSPAAPILTRAVTTLGISFEKHPGAVPPSKQQGISRFPENPTANWGPKSRAGKRWASLGWRWRRGRRRVGRANPFVFWPGSTGGELETQEAKRARLQSHRTKVEKRPDIRCYRFFNGECDLGDDCRYSHDPASTLPVAEKKKKQKQVLRAQKDAGDAMDTAAVATAAPPAAP